MQSTTVGTKARLGIGRYLVQARLLPRQRLRINPANRKQYGLPRPLAPRSLWPARPISTTPLCFQCESQALLFVWPPREEDSSHLYPSHYSLCRAVSPRRPSSWMWMELMQGPGQTQMTKNPQHRNNPRSKPSSGNLRHECRTDGLHPDMVGPVQWGIGKSVWPGGDNYMHRSSSFFLTE